MPRLLDRWRRGRDSRRSIASLERALASAESGPPHASPPDPADLLARLGAVRADAAVR